MVLNGGYMDLEGVVESGPANGTIASGTVQQQVHVCAWDL